MLVTAAINPRPTIFFINMDVKLNGVKSDFDKNFKGLCKKIKKGVGPG